MRWTPTWSSIPAVCLLALTACSGSSDPTETESPDTTDATLEVVVASSCEPLAGAGVRVFGEGEGTPTETGTTGQEGTVAFPELAAGTYAVEVEPPAGHGLNPEESDRKSTYVSASTIRRVAFALVSDPQPSVTDHEGNTYPAVKIGDRVWMAENLRVTTFANGDPIPARASVGDWEAAVDQQAPGWSYYDNDPDHGAAYGPLYNDYAATDPRGVCPTGWHVPTETDWQALELELGVAEGFLGRTGWAGGEAGVSDVLRSTRTGPSPHPRWDEPNEGARNCTGFSALPQGYRVGEPKTGEQVTGEFRELGRETPLWSATPASDTTGHWGRSVRSNRSGIYRNTAHGFGFGIRCVKDGTD